MRYKLNRMPNTLEPDVGCKTVGKTPCEPFIHLRNLPRANRNVKSAVRSPKAFIPTSIHPVIALGFSENPSCALRNVSGSGLGISRSGSCVLVAFFDPLVSEEPPQA